MSNEGGGASRTTEPAAGSSAATDVPLKEFFGERLGRTNDNLAADRKLNRDRFAFVGVLGAAILFYVERHMGDLNHENARVKSIADSRVAQATYDANEQQRDKESAELSEWRKEVDHDRTQSVSRIDLARENRGDAREDQSDRVATRDSYVNQIRALAAAITVALALLTYATLHYRHAPDAPTQTVTTTTTVPNP